MKHKAWLFIFLVVLIADLICIQTGYQPGQYLFKPLIVPVLIVYFLIRTEMAKHPLTKWMLLAFFFSWAGDVLLMFPGELYFLLGLSAFLLAHIFYIVIFHKIRVWAGIPGNAWLLVLVVIYYGFLVSWLSPWLGDMKLPVRLYGIVISFMLLLALHLGIKRTIKGGSMVMMGAILFILSDSLLAINKFYATFTGAGLFIMLTYGAAQLLIAEGVIRFIRGIRQR